MTADLHRRVLVVEDDSSVSGLLNSVLRQRGLTVDVADGGAEAIAHLSENSYAVILLDLLMPQPDGFAVLQAIKNGTVQAPPVVLVITGADRSLVEKLDPRSIHGVVRKPFDAEELASLVVACSEIRSKGSMGMMAVAMISSARLFDFLG
jgi:DNA-binding response OmpR family regulator